MTNILSHIVKYIGSIEWKFKDGLTLSDIEQIKKKLIPDYYIILTRRRNHLSTYFIAISYIFLRKKIGHYVHTLMNLEDDVQSNSDFRLIEATGKGIHYSNFEDVFNCHSVSLLRPKNMTLEDWTQTLDQAKKQLGKKYDTLFDLKSDKELSCVELIRVALQTLPDYELRFAHFEKMIKESKNLHPQMFYDCEDFIVEYEVRR